MTPQEAAKLAIEQLEKEAELRKRIAEDASEYVKLMKSLKNLNEDINTVNQQIAKISSQTFTVGTQEYDIQQKKLKILRDELAVLTETQKTYVKVIKETNKYAKSLSAIGMAAKDVKSIYSTITGGFSRFKAWSGLFEVDKSIRTASTSMGLLGARSDMFRKNLQLAAGQTTIFGADIKELAEIQGTFSDELGRAALLSAQALESVAAIGRGTGIGAEGAARMAADFEKQGISAERTGEFIKQVVSDTSRMGINSSKVVKNIQLNMKMLNKYNFKDGVKGLAKMAERAAKLGIDMGFTSSMAEKLFDLEGAVDMSAQLQVLGGEWSKLADPFKLMYMARNDVDALEESVINAAAASADFSDKTGKFEIGAMEMQRLRKVAEAAGLEFETLAAAAKTAAQAVGVRTQIRYNFDKETKEFIENTSTLNEKGEAVIQLESGPKLVKQLSMADQQAIKAAMDEKASLQKRAQEALTFDETISNVVTQMKQLLLPFLEAFDKAFRPVAIELAKVLSDKNVIEGIQDAAKTAAKVMGVIGEFIAENPLKSIAIAIGGLGLLEAAKWYTMGLSFGAGFNTVSGGMGVKGMAMNFVKFAGPALGALVVSSFAGLGFDKLFGEKKKTDTWKENWGKKLARLGTMTAVGAGTGAAIGGIPTGGIGAVPGAVVGGVVGLGKGLYDEFLTEPVNDGIIRNNINSNRLTLSKKKSKKKSNMPSLGPNFSKKRAILQGKNVTPIDNKDDILAMKRGGIVDKVMSQNAGVNTVKHEFGDLNITGEIVLRAPGNEKINMNLAKNPEFVSEITRMIHVEAAKMKNQVQKG